MKDIVSFETAKRLKEAGFPQHISNNDCWYAANGDCFLQWHGGDIWIGGEMPITREVDAPFFAPTATDILVRLPDLTALYKWRHENVWCVDYQTQDPPLLTGTPHRHKNPAEACAEAWLKLNKK